MSYVLLIDAERIGRLATYQALQNAGFEVQECESGNMGLEKVSLKVPSAVVLSEGISDAERVRFARTLRRNILTANVPIIGYFYSECDRDFQLFLCGQVDKPNVQGLIEVLGRIRDRAALAPKS